MSANALKKAFDDALSAGQGVIGLDKAHAILAAHRVRQYGKWKGYLTIVLDAKSGIENDYFVDLVTNENDDVTGLKVEQDVGQYL